MLTAIVQRFLSLSFAAAGCSLFVLGFAIPQASNFPFVILVIFAVLSLLFEARQAPTKRPLGLLWLFFFAIAFVISVPGSVDVHRSLKLSVSLLPAGLMYFLIAGQIRCIGQLRIVLVSLSTFALIASAQMISEVLVHPGGHPETWIRSLDNPIFVVPNDLAFLAVVSPVSVGLLLCERDLRIRLIALAAILGSALAIGLYQSRTGVLTMLIASGVCLWFLRPRLLVAGAVVLSSVVVIADGWLGFPLLGKFGSLAEHRIALWIAAWRMFLDAPLLGHGPHSFGLLVHAYIHGLEVPDWGPLRDLAPPWHKSMYSPWAHNLYMETLAAQGIIGLAALLGLLVSGFRAGWRMRAAADGQVRTYAIAVTSGLLGFGLAGTYELSFLRIWVVVTLLVFVAALASLHRFSGRPVATGTSGTDHEGT